MGVAFKEIAVGSQWDRKELAELWGYQSFHAFGRGVFTPQNDNKIVLFVKEQKRDEDEQYEDRLDGNFLHWHGEKGHGSDQRIAHAHERGDEIHVFYRASHRRTARVKVFIDFVTALFHEMEAERERGVIARVGDRPDWYGRRYGHVSATVRGRK